MTRLGLILTVFSTTFLLVFNVYYRFTHIDQTEARQFVDTWAVQLACVSICLVGLILVRKGTKY